MSTEDRLNCIAVNYEEVLYLIDNLNKGKSCGPDNISAQMLIVCDKIIVLPIKIIYQRILPSRIFLQIWKSANLTPVHKQGNTYPITSLW